MATEEATVSLMSDTLKRILIVDEEVFGRICSAILKLEGYDVGTATSFEVETETDGGSKDSLMVTSYPYCRSAFQKFNEVDTPLIILTDQIDAGLMTILQNNSTRFCMVKPIDFGRFKTLVRDLMHGQASLPGGFNVF
jgi:DNA-binding response OmpR family regulator